MRPAPHLLALALLLIASATPAQVERQRPVVGEEPPQPEEVFVMDPPGVVAEDFATGLEAVWDIVFLPDGAALVSERPGRIRYIDPDGELAEAPWAEPDNVHHGGGGGMMGLALHPEFPAVPWVYAMYTAHVDAGIVNRVARFRHDGPVASDHEIVIDYLPAAHTHNGGRIAFGPDGMLYVTIGDTGQRAQSQNVHDLRGSILRVTPEGQIPADNPWPGTPVWAAGLRNVHGLAFHPETGELLAADHGPSGEWRDPLIGQWDEINVVRGGGNYGWPLVVGAAGAEGYIDPIVAWGDTAVPPGGMAFYTGELFEELQGDLLLTTLLTEALVRIRFADPDDPTRPTAIERWFTDRDLGRAPAGEGPSRYGRLRAITVGPDGAIYVGTSNIDRDRGTIREGDDRILRLTPAEE